MGNKWPEFRLDEITTLIIDCPHSTPEWTDSGVIVLRSNNIRNGALDLTTPSFTTEEGYLDRIKRAIPSENDIVLTREAPMGEVCIIPKGLKCCLGQRMVLIRADITQVLPEYLLYTIQSSYIQNQISWNEGTGTTVSNIRIPNIKALKIPLPGLSIQRKIAANLLSIDKNISLNNSINQTLEQMSQTLFKSWFVDFDPVIDNALDAGKSIPEALQSRAELRQKVRNSADFKPLPADIRVLFPAEFEETELGWVPKGWKSETFDSFCDFIQSGGTPSRKETSFWDDGTIKWLSSGEVKGKIVLDTKEKITETGLLHSSAKLWKKYTTVVAMYGATAGEVCIIGDKMTANQACCALHSEKHPFYVYNFVNYKADELASKATGSAQQNLNKLIISSTKFIRPSNSIITTFEDNVAPLFIKWFSNSSENNILTNLRDTLLPKLISGELSLEDLPDLIKQTEAA